MEFSQTEERWLANKPDLVERIDLVTDELPEREWGAGRATDARRSGLIHDGHAIDAGIAKWHSDEAASNVVLDDRGAPIPSSLMNGPGLAELQRLERRRAKIAEARRKLDKEAKVPPGRTGWSVKAEEVKALVRKIAGDNATIDSYALKGKPSRKGMAEAAKVAEAGHARRKLIVDAYPDRATAEAMVRGIVREESPLHLIVAGYAMAHDLRLPLVDVKWGPGRDEPLPEDTAQMFTFLAAERIEDDLLEQLDRRYADFKERGVLTLTVAERRRELAIVDDAIHAAEVEEAAHLIGIIESENSLILPPARMSAKALLGIV